jgi:hypothetical protein
MAVDAADTSFCLAIEIEGDLHEIEKEDSDSSVGGDNRLCNVPAGYGPGNVAVDDHHHVTADAEHHHNHDIAGQPAALQDGEHHHNNLVGPCSSVGEHPNYGYQDEVR